MGNPGVPELPRFSFPMQSGDVESLNQFVFQLRRLLLGRLTTANQRTQVLTTVIQWPIASVPRVKTNPVLTRRPVSVTLAAARTGTSETIPATIAASLEWDFQAGSILLPQFENNVLTTRWELTLLVVEE